VGGLGGRSLDPSGGLTSVIADEHGAGSAAAGVAIPSDLSLVSMDDGEQLASRLVPQLTTIEGPDRAMAEQAVTVTLQAVDEENGGEIRQLTLDCSPAIRDSVGRPRPPNRRLCRPADRR
jgi:DNA-binding LacI/PurR family transcriptional regulator